MTFFEFIVPVIALGLAGIGVLWIRHEGRTLDARIRRADAEARRAPAE